MNIFYIHENPTIAAMQLGDKHVVKMIVETAQILSTAHRVCDGYIEYKISKSGRRIKKYKLSGIRDAVLYQAAYINHPSTVWARQSPENYRWLYQHFIGLISEYIFRYNKFHKSQALLDLLQLCPMELHLSYKNKKFTPPPEAMPRKYIISSDALINYRNYYRKAKKHLHQYTKRKKPHWVYAKSISTRRVKRNKNTNFPPEQIVYSPNYFEQ